MKSGDARKKVGGVYILYFIVTIIGFFGMFENFLTIFENFWKFLKIFEIQSQNRRDSESSSIKDEDFEVGILNSGKRIDYQVIILQYFFLQNDMHEITSLFKIPCFNTKLRNCSLGVGGIRTTPFLEKMVKRCISFSIFLKILAKRCLKHYLSFTKLKKDLKMPFFEVLVKKIHILKNF